MANHIDRLVLFLAILALFAFLMAVVFSLMFALRSVVPEVNQLSSIDAFFGQSVVTLPKVDFDYVSLGIPSVSFVLPMGLQVGNILSVSFLLMSGILFLAARRRISNNLSLQSFVGCPSCQEHELMRVHRNWRDRVISISCVPVARYQCRDCHWNGLRIKEKQGRVKKAKGATLIPTTIDTKNRATTAVPGNPSPQGLEETVVVSKNNNSAVTQPLEISDPFSIEELNSQNMLSQIISWEKPFIEGEPPQDQAIAQDREKAKDFERTEIIAPLGLNLRQDPQPDGAVIDMLEPGTIVQLLDNRKQEDGITWREIRVNDQNGWVSDAFLGKRA